MIQKMMIEIESAKPVSSYGDGHILVLDGIRNRYYVTTREAFLVEQDKKIENLNTSFSNLQSNTSQFMVKMNDDISNFEKITKEDIEKFKYMTNLTNKEFKNYINQKFDDFKKDMTNQYNEFLKQYKETNEKMIELIKTVVITEE